MALDGLAGTHFSAPVDYDCQREKICEAPYGAEFGSQAASERSGVLTNLEKVHELR